LSPPMLLGKDFPFLNDESPLRKCLDVEADNAREVAMKTLLHEETGISEKAAADLVDVAFISLARLDDNNRWVRHFASPEEIAAASGLDLPLERRKELVELALEEFRESGYVWFRNGQYDVTHEALIRSWDHYRRILGETQLVIRSLISLDEIMADKEKQAVLLPSSMPAPDFAEYCRRIVVTAATRRTYFNLLKQLGTRLQNAVRFVLLQHWQDASRHLQRGRKEALERIFVSPAQFSTAWVEQRLINQWRQKAKLTGAAPLAMTDDQAQAP